MSLKWHPKQPERLDPYDMMVGKCQSCGSDVTTTRNNTKQAGDWRVAPCPKCGAAVSVITRPNHVEK